MTGILRVLRNIIFFSRWLQAPLYVGLILAQGVYVYKFAEDLYELIHRAAQLSENEIMLVVIALIDVVMIANLLIMVIIGGYETFVSRLHLEGHEDQPEWLDHLNAGSMKVKFSMSLIGISSIHLLRTFLEPGQLSNDEIMWQVVIHLTFVISSLLMAYTNNLMMINKPGSEKKQH